MPRPTPTLRDLLEQSGAIQALGDVGSRIRYGVPYAVKEAMAIRGEIPGYDPRNARSAAGQEIEQRRAAAYLFGRSHPTWGPEYQPFIDMFRQHVGGDSPDVLSVAQDAVERGAFDAQREAEKEAVRQRVTLGMLLSGALGK